MTETDTYDEQEVERERTKSFELGRVSKLEDVASDLRERAGEIFAHASSRTDRAKAEKLKDLAEEYQAKADEDREEWKEKYNQKN